MTNTSLRHAGLILIATTAVAKLVGFLREAVIASAYGTTHTVDIYLAAMTLPAMVVTIAFHSIPNAFVPLFAERSGRIHVRRQAVWLLGVMALLSAGAWVLAKPLAGLTNAGFPPEYREETVVVLRITAVAIAMATIEALTRSRLLAQRRFLRAGLSLMWQSAVMIVAIWLFPSGGARTLAWGFVAGGAAAALWNLLPARGRTDVAMPVPDPIAAESAGVSIKFWVPLVLLADSIPQLYSVIDRHLASYLAEGSIASLQYSSLIATMPVSICGLTLGTAILPFLSTAIHDRNMARASDIFDKAIRWSLLVVVPVTIWMLFFANDVTRLLYQRGAFGEASRQLTASTLFVYTMGLIPNVLMAIAAKVFYALRRWGPLLLASSLGIIAKWFLSILWVDQGGTAGLAAAAVAGYVIGMCVLAVALPGSLLARWRGWAKILIGLGVVCSCGSLVTVGLIHALPELSSALIATIRLSVGACLCFVGIWWAAPRIELVEFASIRAAIKRPSSRS
ncbi:MAG: hypothetical protein HZB43_05365 [candidate division Zixibacteria bacterium]|nr:hypothetical protein [candidate division Zixibacteria bacterium]